MGKAMQIRWDDKRCKLVLATIVFILFFLFLGQYGLLEPDEGRYAEIPREMLETGDFITPHLNYVKYFEKPVLHYWLTALSVYLFGETEFAARFWPAALALAGVLMVYTLGRTLYDARTGLFAGLILATSLEYYLLANLNTTDMTLTFFLTVVLVAFCRGYLADAPAKGRWYDLAYAAAALAVLTKGLIGIVLPGIVLAVWLVYTRQWSLLREIRPLRGLVIILVVAAPWFIAVSLKNPEFPYFFFIREHFLRYTTKFARRYQPFYYFLPILVIGAFPWIGFCLAGIRNCFIRPGQDASPRQRVLLFLLLWVVVITLFFSFSDSKLPPYILPVFPALAVIGAQTLAAYIGGEAKQHFTLGWGMALALAVPCAVALVTFPLASDKYASPALQRIALVVAVILLLGLLLTLWLHRRQNYRGATVAMLLTAVCFLMALKPAMGYYAQVRSAREIAAIVADFRRPGDHIADYRYYHQGLVFYLKQRIILVDELGELEFGASQGDNRAWFISREDFDALWHKPEPVIAVISPADYQALQAKGYDHLHLLATSGKNMIISNKSDEELRRR